LQKIIFFKNLIYNNLKKIFTFFLIQNVQDILGFVMQPEEIL